MFAESRLSFGSLVTKRGRGKAPPPQHTHFYNHSRSGILEPYGSVVPNTQMKKQIEETAQVWLTDQSVP